MARIHCDECGYRYSSRARRCPKCHARPPGSRNHFVVIGLVSAACIVVLLGVLYFSGAFDHSGQLDLASLQKQEAEDAVEHYNFAKRYGSVSERCTQSGLAAEAFRELKDMASYRIWRDVQAKECAKSDRPAPQPDAGPAPQNQGT